MSGEVSSVTVVRGAASSVLVAFPPSWLGFELDDTDGDARTAERPETGREVLGRLPRVVALLDGPMFELVEGGTNYAASRGSRLLYRYLDRRHGINVATRYPERGATVSVTPEGRVSVVSGAGEVEGAVFACQGYPELIRDGRLVARDVVNTDRVGRAALCVLDDGRVAFAVGRAPMAEFGRALLNLQGVRVRDAIYTDGGGSTTLALRGEGGRLEIAQGLDSRRLPVYILAEPPASGVGMVNPSSGSEGEGFLLRLWRSPWFRVVGGSAVATGALAVGVHLLRSEDEGDEG